MEEFPLADGGEGTAQVLVAATGGRMERRRVHGPLGEPVEANFGVLGDGRTGVIEMAAAAGLTLVPPGRRDPAVTTTYGVGELIRAALDAGCTRLVIGIGGSATNDGGAGCAQALGAILLDAAGRPLPLGGASLSDLARIDVSRLDPRLVDVPIDVACDVNNPLCGSGGASAVFGPQKGAAPQTVERLDKALAHYAAIVRRDLGCEIADLPGAGAAGGLGAGLIAFCGARLVRGIELVMQAVGFEAAVRRADLVITGEGRLDAQTVFGKVAQGVAGVAARCGKPVIAIAGGIGAGAADLYGLGISGMISIVPGPASLAEAIDRADAWLVETGERVARLIEIGRRLPGG